jgi:GntR family transcriptional regulator / MocR family aminotransferase
MAKSFSFRIDRSAKTPLAEQIRKAIGTAIETGVLKPGARLPSWQDLAAQLGVARGTVRTAYERLAAAQLIIASRSSGTHVADRPRRITRAEPPPDPGSFMEMYQEMTRGPALFQMGVPAPDIFPAKLFARIRAHAVRVEAGAALIYPDPRGELELRQEIAGYLAISRGIKCSPAQVVITSGFASGLGTALRVLSLEGKKAWMEEPGFPFTRHGLALARLTLAPIPVDADGINVDYGLKYAGDAKLVVVTPGQQAPLGVTLSLERRLRLLDWAAHEGAWVIEDDYLSELQLKGRAAPALASLDRDGRVIHLGSFSKTISPTLRLGFIIAPLPLLSHFAEVAACLAPPPGPSVQRAVAAFMREGHYLRHLRRTKRSYSAKREAVLDCLKRHGAASSLTTAGLAALLLLPDGASDVKIVRELLGFGLAPAPLSAFYARPACARPGLLLGVATAPTSHLAQSCDRLFEVIERFT